MHAFCTYMDSRLPPNPNCPDGKTFTNQHFRSVSGWFLVIYLFDFFYWVILLFLTFFFYLNQVQFQRAHFIFLKSRLTHRITKWFVMMKYGNYQLDVTISFILYLFFFIVSKLNTMDYWGNFNLFLNLNSKF